MRLRSTDFSFGFPNTSDCSPTESDTLRCVGSRLAAKKSTKAARFPTSHPFQVCARPQGGTHDNPTRWPPLRSTSPPSRCAPERPVGRLSTRGFRRAPLEKSFRVFHSRLSLEGHPSLPNATLTDTPPLLTNRRSTTTTRVRRKILTARRKRVRPETRARPHPNERHWQLSTTRVRVDDDHARGSRRRSRVEPPTSAPFARGRNRRSSPRVCGCLRPSRAMPRGPTGEAREPKTSRALARGDRTLSEVVLVL